MPTIKLKTPIRVDYGDVKTVLSAERKIRELSVDLRWYGPTHPSADMWIDGIVRCAAAIAETTGETVPEIMQRLDDKIERSYRAAVKRSDDHWNALRASQPHLDALMSAAEAVDSPRRNY